MRGSFFFGACDSARAVRARAHMAVPTEVGTQAPVRDALADVYLGPGLCARTTAVPNSTLSSGYRANP
jgi:hypothetical protein